MNPTDLSHSIEKNAAQCVKCGLCLPHCPTYVLTENECESPRGRISLMNGVANQQLPLTEKLTTYLDHCLTCLACERVCPAEVKYDHLINDARTLINIKTNNQKKLPWLLITALRYPQILRAITRLLRTYQRSGLQNLLRNSKLLNKIGLARLESYLPVLPQQQAWQSYYPPQNNEQGRVALFTGCINNVADPATLAATIKTLTYCGYGVYVPKTQHCCGALQIHAGYPQLATPLTQANLQAFAQTDITAIITVATGCSAVLKNQGFAAPVYDISQFLVTVNWPDNLQLQAYPKRVAIHVPCTLRNVLQQPEAPQKLLQKIPEVNCLELKTSCCGAAGLYMIQDPQMADGLLESALQQLEVLKPEILVTSNIGCALHFGRALSMISNIDVPVLHPVQLIAQQLQLNVNSATKKSP